MPRNQTADSVADRIRAFLVARPDWTHDRIARECKTTESYVDKVSSKARRQGKPLPNRREARKNAPPEDEGGSTVATSEAPRADHAGLRLVSIVQLTPPPVSPPKEGAPEWRCDQCGHEGSGKAPAACPKCGGA